MTCATETRIEDGVAVVVHRASGDDARALRAAGERLCAAAHPGVVELLASDGTDDRWELRVAHGGRPLEVAGPLAVEQVANVVASVAATLADLHAAGIAHGRIDASHVLLGPQGRALLCGFGGHERAAARPEDDVAALGALIDALLGPTAGAPASRTRDRLLSLADLARAEPPTRRPTAARLAAAIAEVVPASARPLRRRRRPAAWATAGVVVLVMAALRLTHGAPPPAVVGDAVAPPSCAEQASRPVGCGESIEVDGTAVHVGTRRFVVGEPGDRIVVGDWDGDQLRTAAVLRPSTGEVFVFRSWTSAAPVAIGPTARIAGAVELVVERRGDRDVLFAARRDGSRVAIGSEVAS